MTMDGEEITRRKITFQVKIKGLWKKREVTVDVVYYPNWMALDMIDHMELRGAFGFKSIFRDMGHTEDMQVITGVLRDFFSSNKAAIRKAIKASEKPGK